MMHRGRGKGELEEAVVVGGGNRRVGLGSSWSSGGLDWEGEGEGGH
jgi:hypothetical protein